jgi:AcrR family transcriptional regulator
MTTQSRKRLPSAQRRAVIEESAGTLFAERGYAGTRLDDIAATAEVTKPVLYRHFDSKKALYLALLDRHRRDLPSFIERVPPDLPPDRRVRGILEAWFAYVEDHGYAWKMIFRDSGGDEEIRAFRLDVQARAREVLVAFIAAQQEISIPAQEVEALAEFLRTGGAGLALWWLDHPDVPRATVVDVFSRVVSGLAQPSR